MVCRLLKSVSCVGSIGDDLKSQQMPIDPFGQAECPSRETRISGHGVAGVVRLSTATRRAEGQQMELILVRHGRPERTEATADPPLSSLGQDQAARVARWLANDAIDAVWSSTMRRAIQTAEHFAAQAGHAVRPHPGIVEFAQASGAYIPTEELKRENFAAWQKLATGGDAVDLAVFQARVVQGMESIITAHPGQKVAVFCHGGVINVWTAHVLGMQPRIFFEADYTSINRFSCARSGQRSVVSLNERAHLRERA
jgi:2,3-bisphosphoglycerate-dependent phosphoglycerate mutase